MVDSKNEHARLDLRLSMSAAIFLAGQAAFWVGYLFLPWRSTAGVSGAFIIQLVINAPALVQPTLHDYLMLLIPAGMVAAGVGRARWHMASLLAVFTVAECLAIVFPDMQGVAAGFWLVLAGSLFTLASVFVQNRF